ncbi:DUF222 domain-containing protein [Microbacterium sp. NPDC058345]|uniref:HNH endonuclease n=1 Tax=Microbacterium sp. NPDC058345 TaxID=3346455 RepID=UPI003650434D
MSEHLSPLHEAVAALDAVWADAGAASELSRFQLVGANDAIGKLRRRLDALHAEVAAAIAHESRTELGADSLAKQQGYRNPAQLIAASTGSSSGDAARLVQVGEATAARADLLGAPLPPKYPAVQAALNNGSLGAPGANIIIRLLERVRPRVGRERVAEAERQLTERAVGLSLDEVRRLVARAEAQLEPELLEQREEERFAQRSLTMFQRDGNLHVSLVTTVESGAPIIAALDGYVSSQFAARKDAPDADAADADRRTVAMMRADALSVICSHVTGCDNDRVPLNGATVVVRVNLDDLTAGSGHGTIDGIEQPVSISAVRRMAASGGVIPCVLGSDGEILDWGRERRFFSPAQKLALAERDGGCAMCGLPPSMTKAHHLRWWLRDGGTTDLSNGVLLCETCHHRIHDNGWEIRIEPPPGGPPGSGGRGDGGRGEGRGGGEDGRPRGGRSGGRGGGRGGGTGVHTTAKVWFIPPAYVDPDRTPRLGGRARYEIAA